jgi:hypothetical protein
VAVQQLHHVLLVEHLLLQQPQRHLGEGRDNRVSVYSGRGTEPG